MVVGVELNAAAAPSTLDAGGWWCIGVFVRSEEDQVGGRGPSSHEASGRIMCEQVPTGLEKFRSLAVFFYKNQINVPGEESSLRGGLYPPKCLHFHPSGFSVISFGKPPPLCGSVVTLFLFVSQRQSHRT